MFAGINQYISRIVRPLLTKDDLEKKIVICNPQIKVAKPPIVAEEPLHAELRSFLESVRTRKQPLVSFEDGRRALALALDIVSAIREHGSKVNLDQLHG